MKKIITDIAKNKMSISMGGDADWQTKVNRLIDILAIAAPKKERPRYHFTPYYFCENGYWYESNHQSNSVPVMDIECSKPC
jgi:hypothetical protein